MLWPARPRSRGQLFEEDEVESVTKVSELLRQVQFRVVGGRVVADSARQGLSLTTETRDLAGGRWERLTLDMSNDAPGLIDSAKPRRTKSSSN